MDGFVESGGLRIHYVDHGGVGPPLVMLPGLNANTHFFDAVIEDGLGSAAHCIALDLRGRGQSDRPASGFGLDDHAADVIGVLDALKLDRVVLAGIPTARRSPTTSPQSTEIVSTATCCSIHNRRRPPKVSTPSNPAWPASL